MARVFDEEQAKAILVALHAVLSRIPHRPYCARRVLRVKNCTCDVGDRIAIAYDTIGALLHDLRKGTR